MNWTAFFLFFPFLIPGCIYAVCPWLKYVFFALEAVSALILVYLYIRNRASKKLHLIVWAFAALEIWFLAAAAIDGGVVKGAFFYNAFPAGFMVLLINYYSDDIKRLVPALLLNFEWLIYVELINILVFGEHGLYNGPLYSWPGYFLGHENNFISYGIPAVCLAMLHLRQSKTVCARFRSVSIIAVCFFIVFFTWPATAVVAFSVMVIVGLLYLIPSMRRIFSFPVLFALTLVGNYFIVICRVTEKVPFVSAFIEKVMHKSVTLSGRDIVWDSFLKTMPGHWLLGLGYQPDGNIYLEEKKMFIQHTHNEYYEMLVQGGAIQLVLLFVILIIVCVVLYKHRGTYSACVYSSVLTAVCTAWIAEKPTFSIFSVFTLAFFVKETEKSICGISTPETHPE